jgi:prevent-host-death family protein
MKRVNIADLKNNLSRHLSHVRTGGDIVVLDRNIPVARVIPFDRSAPAPAGKPRSSDTYWTGDRLADLEQRGTITRGGAEAVATWLETQRPIRLPKGAPGAVDILLKQRRQSTR